MCNLQIEKGELIPASSCELSAFGRIASEDTAEFPWTPHCPSYQETDGIGDQSQRFPFLHCPNYILYRTEDRLKFFNIL